MHAYHPPPTLPSCPPIDHHHPTNPTTTQWYTVTTSTRCLPAGPTWNTCSEASGVLPYVAMGRDMPPSREGSTYSAKCWPRAEPPAAPPAAAAAAAEDGGVAAPPKPRPPGSCEKPTPHHW